MKCSKDMNLNSKDLTAVSYWFMSININGMDNRFLLNFVLGALFMEAIWNLCERLGQPYKFPIYIWEI